MVLTIEKDLDLLSVNCASLRISTKGDIKEFSLSSSIEDFLRDFNIYFSVRSMSLSLFQEWHRIPRLKPFRKLERLRFKFSLEDKNSHRLLTGVLDHSPLLKELVLSGYLSVPLLIKHPVVEVVDARDLEVKGKYLRVEGGVKTVLRKH